MAGFQIIRVGNVRQRIGMVQARFPAFGERQSLDRLGLHSGKQLGGGSDKLALVVCDDVRGQHGFFDQRCAALMPLFKHA